MNLMYLVDLDGRRIRLEGDAPGRIDLVRSYYKDIFLLLPGTPAKVLENEAAPRQGSCQGGLP